MKLLELAQRLLLLRHVIVTREGQTSSRRRPRAMASDDPAPVFSELSAESGQPSSVESMCVNCMENVSLLLISHHVVKYKYCPHRKHS